MPRNDFLDRIVQRRAQEQVAAADLTGRERDSGRIVGPVKRLPRRKSHKCRGCLKMPEYTKGYCLKCYSRVRLGRSLEFLEDDDDE